MNWLLLVSSLLILVVCITWKSAERIYDRKIKKLKAHYSAAYHRLLSGKENER